MREQYFDLVLVTLEQQAVPAWEIAERIQTCAKDLRVKGPDMILLSEKQLPVYDAIKCRDMQAMCMPREYPRPAYEEARIVFWKRSTRKHNLTMRIAFRNGHHDLSFETGFSSAPLLLGAQLTKFALTLAGGRESYPVDLIADTLGICRQSVKKYLHELRQKSIAAQETLNIVHPERGVFWMERRPGGTVCGIKANIIWT